jgi:hypothetical protein
VLSSRAGAPFGESVRVTKDQAALGEETREEKPKPLFRRQGLARGGDYDAELDEPRSHGAAA